jgi:hypothetical protein
MPFHPDLIGLHVFQIEICLHHLILMHRLAVLSRSLLPSGHRAFIQSEGVNNGLSRAAIREQRHDKDDEIFRLASSLKHRSSMRAKRLPTAFTLVALALLPMTDQITFPCFPSCRTVPVRAK